jgi:hypothetical protein
MKLRTNYFENFPELRDPIVVVVDAVTPDLAHDTANRLARRLGRKPELFPGVYQPDGGKFFDEHGLLYLSVSELQDMVDRLSLAQPFLSRLSRDQSIGGLFTLLDEAGEAMESEQLEQSMLGETFDSVSRAIDDYLAGRNTPLSWQQLLDAKENGKKQYRRFLLIRPVVDFSRIHPAEDTLLGLREVVAELGLARNGDVRVRAGELPDGNLLRTGTARAVLLSALTTMASFGTLAFSSHSGIASLGQLLTLGIALVLLCNLVVLPALVRVTDKMRA